VRRIPIASQTGMATTASRHLIWPLNAAIGIDNIAETIASSRVGLYRHSSSNHRRHYSTSGTALKEETNNDGRSSPFSSSPLVTKHKASDANNNNTTRASPKKTKRKKKFVPRKAAVELTENARTLFQKLLENHPTRDGILLNYNQSSTGEPRMVFSFSFVSRDELDEQDEGVSLEVDEDGNPKPPKDALDDGLPKLYVHHNAFLKVLGATVDVDTKNITPILYDKEGFELDANV